ncbi:hypothetical protein [Bacillus sp. UNC438CL73TsuS30]|uniref:hypothetical protein n=1 Tax=Bacillus sp. UNC438CL73TsuS30 TaxID=1340434 RepID=UPI00047D62C0|nr:hypothetical protein [Bacillus sp. UNC438CL73TsuS30]
MKKAIISFIFVFPFTMVNTASFAGTEAGNKLTSLLKEHILVLGKGKVLKFYTFHDNSSTIYL